MNSRTSVERKKCSRQRFDNFFENIPIPVCYRNDCNANGLASAKSGGARILDESGNELSGVMTRNQFRIEDNAGNGVRVTFPESRSLNIEPEGFRMKYWDLTKGYRELDVGRVEVNLPKQWQFSHPLQ